MDLNAFCVVFFLQLLSRFLAIVVTAVVSNPLRNEQAVHTTRYSQNVNGSRSSRNPVSLENLFSIRPVQGWIFL